MRVSDSLELGLSLFMASLVRLQQIVHAARIATADRRVCFLLDEVLQGTNSAERQIAVRTVVDHLLGCEAIGAVTTHDLELARDAGFTAHADSFHLQETLAGSGADHLDDLRLSTAARTGAGWQRAATAAHARPRRVGLEIGMLRRYKGSRLTAEDNKARKCSILSHFRQD